MLEFEEIFARLLVVERASLLEMALLEGAIDVLDLIHEAIRLEFGQQVEEHSY